LFSEMVFSAVWVIQLLIGHFASLYLKKCKTRCFDDKTIIQKNLQHVQIIYCLFLIFQKKHMY